jgi:uncharacterized protein (TIGR03067 family)
MKRYLLAACLSVLGVTALAQNTVPKDLVPLQGTWVITSVNGQELATAGTSMLLTITGDKYAQTVNGTVNERGTLKLDTSKKPAAIDLIITEGDDANKTQFGLFDVSGTALKLKLALPGQTTRPANFDQADGTILVIATKK